MRLTAPKNENYAATVFKIKSITKLDGCDNVVGSPIFGFQAIVGKDTKVGDIGIVFPAETQLSEEYARQNNLYRHSGRNNDKGAKGYLEDNRRVKAMKFRGHRSDCLFMPLTSLNFTGDINLNEGDTFDELNGHEICKKYMVYTPREKTNVQQSKQVRVESKFLPEHVDTENYFRNEGAISGNTRIVATQKLHGTSIRIGHTVVNRKLNLRERIAKYVGVLVQEAELDYVFGSRKVIKDSNIPGQNHYYETDLWSIEGKKLEGVIPENFLVYGELIGYTPNNAPIQANFTYNLPEKTCALYVYRIATINGQGRTVDLSWEQVKQFCAELGLKHVPELWSGLKKNFKPEKFLDVKFSEKYKNAVPLSEESPCDEGVCVRIEGLTPRIYKAKSPLFFEFETKMLDQEVVDLETEGSNVAKVEE